MLLPILRIIEILTNPFFKLIAFFSKRKTIPAITNPILVTSATLLAEKIRNRELTSIEVVSAFIDRCKQVNPIVNAILQDRFDDALEDARRVNDLLQSNEISVSQLESEKPLLGIPITVKECCAVKGMMFSIGARKHKNRKATCHGDAVQCLINAGAIPIAVTSTPLGCAYPETFNSIIGYTSNPYDTRKTSGGSSGGEAALIASAASVLGLGSDAGGSIRVPAALCGIYGHKSTNDMVSPVGLPSFFTNDHEAKKMITVGPLCRYAIDLELVMKVLSASNLQDHSYFSENKIPWEHINVFYLFEYQRDILSVDCAIANRMKQAISHLSSKRGCPIKQLIIPEFEDIIEITWTHFQKITSSVIEKSSFQKNSRETITKKIIKIIHRSPVNRNPKVDNEFYIKEGESLRNKLTAFLEDNGILLLPTWCHSACYKYQSIFKLYNYAYVYFANAFALPSTAVPIGLDDKGMPVSIQIIASQSQDRLCTLVAKELEQLFGGWIPPCEVHCNQDSIAGITFKL